MTHLIIEIVLLGAAVWMGVLWRKTAARLNLAYKELNTQAGATAEFDGLGDQVGRFRHALSWYANANNWRSLKHRTHSLASKDKGYVARAALHGDSVEEAIRHLEPKPPAVRDPSPDAPVSTQAHPDGFPSERAEQ